MKIYRYLLFVITLLTISFFSINNVSAETLFDITSIRSDFELPSKVKDFGTYQNNYDRATQYYLENCVDKYDSYIITNRTFGMGWGENQVNLVCFNSSTNEFIPSLNIGLYKTSTIYLDINIYKGTDYLVRHFYNTSSSTSYNYESGITMELYSYKNIATTELVLDNGIMATNLNFVFTNNRYKLHSVSTPVDALIINDTTYVNNDLIYENGDVISSTPTILISKGDDIITSLDDVDYITGVNMVISTNITDDSKYVCMISTDTENWDKYNCSETYTYKLTQNGTLYARIVDKDSESTINSTTYTISSIQDLPLVGDKVTIYFQKITEDVDSELYNQCTIEQGTVSYRACETFSISFDVINYNKYIYEMSSDGVTWEDVSTRLYNNFFLERIFENKTIYIRVVNRSDYSLNNYSTFTVSSIETPIELGQKVLFSSSYYIQSPDIDVMALFINYDPTNYNYYYSLYNTSESFIDITDSIECTNNLCTFETRIYVKGTMYVRIEDKAGNLIYTATYTVDYYKWMNTNNPFDKEDFFGTFFDSFDYFLNPIKEIFNSISIFFDSLPVELKYTFYVSFVIIIVLFLIKFIL